MTIQKPAILRSLLSVNTFLVCIISGLLFGCREGLNPDRKAIEDILEHYQIAFQEETYDTLASHLSDTFRIDQMPAKLSKQVLQNLIWLNNTDYKVSRINAEKFSQLGDNSVTVECNHEFESAPSIKLNLQFVNDRKKWKLSFLEGGMLQMSRSLHKGNQLYTYSDRKAVQSIISSTKDSTRLSPRDQINIIRNGDTINQMDDSGQFHGLWELAHPDGSFRCKGEYHHGKKEGYWERKYQNGHWMYQSNYKNGQLHGNSRTFYENGQLKFEGNYFEGLENGALKWFREDGSPKTLETYFYGIKNGLCQFYHENGSLMGTGNYIDGRRDGPWIFYDKDGQPTTRIIYEQGKSLRTEQVK